MCEAESGALERPGDRDGGDRDRGHGQAPGPATARAHGARRSTGRLHRGGERASARAQSSSPAVGARPAGWREGRGILDVSGSGWVRGGRWWSGPAADLARALPPLLGAVLSAGGRAASASAEAK